MFSKAQPTSPPQTEALNQRISQLLNISADDIAMNRQGQLSAEQRHTFEAFIKKGQNSTLIIVPLILLFTVAVAYFQIASNDAGGKAIKDAFSDNPAIVLAGLGGSLFLYLAMVGTSLWRSRHMSTDNLKVQAYQGKIKITRVQARGAMWAMMKTAGVQGYSYTISVGRKKVYSFDPHIEEVFMKDAQYIVYYTKMSNVAYFVSAEATL